MNIGISKKAVLPIAAMVMIITFVPGAAWTAGQQESVAWRVSTGGMDWSILVPENGSVLTVGGNGVNYRKVFQAGERPRFTPSDLEGALVDGTYKWELRVAPRGIEPVDESGENNGRETSLSSSRQLPVRARIERRQLEESLVRSGSFTVLSGSIVDPSQVEPGTRPPNPSPSEVQK